MLPQPLTGRMDGVGEVFRTNARVPGTVPPPQIFSHGDFFENKTKRKTVSYGKTTQTARLP